MIHSHTCFQGLCAVLAGAALSHADEPAVSISDFGVDKVMSGPVVSINDQYKGVVKIEMDSLTPDYATPWNTGRYQGGIGTGFLIGENAFMTNAHVVSNAERIYISMYGDSRKIPARSNSSPMTRILLCWRRTIPGPSKEYGLLNSAKTCLIWKTK
nr:S1C family serine protease [Akkermansia muciniphila]